MKRRITGVAVARSMLLLIACFAPGTVWSETIRVGPNTKYGLPSDAAAIAQDGDIVEIAEGNYWGDVAIWPQNNLTLRGVGGGAHLRANGESAQGKGIWIINGRNVTIENIEFSGARASDKNGAGIRQQGTNLTVRRCRFHDNENGILSNDNVGEVLVENSVFANNGHGDGRSHNIYIGQTDRLTIIASYFHDAVVGHNIKSRARDTLIAYSRIEDGREGRSSYLVDIPNGGRVVLIGNILHQGPMAENGTLIAYNAESTNAKFGEVFLINNTLVNDRHAGLFIKNSNPLARVHLQNNIFFGKGELSNREVRDVSNLIVENERSWFGLRKIFRNRDGRDYRLAEGSRAIDAGTDIAVIGMNELYPKYEYEDVAQAVERVVLGQLDIGAYEFPNK